MQSYLKELYKVHPAALVLALIVFCFPVVAVTVDSGATTLFALIFLISLVYGWHGWASLKPDERYLLLGMLAFSAVIALSMTQSEQLDEGISKYSKYLRFAVFVPVYLMLRRWNLDLSKALLAGLLAGTLVMSVILIYQHYWLDVRRPGGERNPIHYSETLMTCSLLVAVASLTVFRRGWQILAGLCVVAIGLFGTYLTLTRGALIVFPFFILLLLIYYKRRMTRIVLAVLVISVIVIAAFSLNPNTYLYKRVAVGIGQVQTFIENPEKEVFASDSVGMRLSMLHAGKQVFLESPVLGTGLGDYTIDVEKLVEQGKTRSKAPIIASSPHNIYVYILAISGAVGFIVMLVGVFALPLYKLLKSRAVHDDVQAQFARLGGMTVIMAYLIYGLSNTWIKYNTSISVYLVLLMVFLTSAARSSEDDQSATTATG